jgi:hypothetical protein
MLNSFQSDMTLLHLRVFSGDDTKGGGGEDEVCGGGRLHLRSAGAAKAQDEVGRRARAVWCCLQEGGWRSVGGCLRGGGGRGCSGAEGGGETVRKGTVAHLAGEISEAITGGGGVGQGKHIPSTKSGACAARG